MSFNFHTILSLQSSTVGKIQSIDDINLIVNTLDKHPRIMEYLYVIHHINRPSAHSHILITYKPQNRNNVVQKPKHLKENLKRIFKRIFPDISSSNKVWLKIQTIKNPSESFLSGYLTSPSDSKIVNNTSSLTDDDIKHNEILYQNALSDSKKKKPNYLVLTNRTAWVYVNNHIDKNNIVINQFQDVIDLKISLFYLGISFSMSDENIFWNKIYLFRNKELKELYHHITPELTFKSLIELANEFLKERGYVIDI